MYISSEEGLEKHYQLLTDLASPSSFVNKYPQLLERLEMFWTKKSEWQSGKDYQGESHQQLCGDGHKGNKRYLGG